MSNFIEMKVRVADDSIELPAYETNSSAGMDLRAYLPDGSITLEPKQRVLVGTGLYFEIPEGFEVQIRPPRSYLYFNTLWNFKIKTRAHQHSLFRIKCNASIRQVRP